MKKVFLLSLIIIAAGLTGSCDYLNVDEYFEDTFKEDSIFANKINITKYYNGAVALLPRDGRIWHYSNVPGITASDEAVSVGRYAALIEIQFPGTILTMDQISSSAMSGWTWDFNVWPSCYKIIRKVNTILPRIDEVPDMNIFDKMELRAQCRFLRAYAYYWILQNQGPMILLGDEILDTNEQPAYYAAERNTYDECIDYICSEFEASAEGLEVSQPVDLFGRPTKGVALALSARLRLQAASPLYNGGAIARRYFNNFTRKSDGVHYISQTYDESKWAIAAAAAKKVIDMGIYSLHTVPADDYTVPLPANVPDALFPHGAGGIDPLRSYAEMFNGETPNTKNVEMIWGTTDDVESHLQFIFPAGFGGNGAVSIPQRIIDNYYMTDGRDIQNASAEYPYENNPYDRSCIVQEDKILSRNYILKQGTYKAYNNREPRFYASIGFSGCHWPMESTTESGKNNLIAKYHNGANCGKNVSNNNVYTITGYVCKKFVHPRDAREGTGARTIQKTLPLIRYAEILLSYAEALNNLSQSYTIDGYTYSRNLQEIKDHFNPVRYRAGLPGVSDEELATPERFNEILQREYMVEFLHENRRYYDTKRWGIMEELEKEPLTGMNVDLDEWNGYYAPTIIAHSSIRERVFKPKFMFLPIHYDELRRVPTLVQNPGWEN